MFHSWAWMCQTKIAHKRLSISHKSSIIPGTCRKSPKLKPYSLSGWWYTYTSEKYESQLGLLFPTYGKSIKSCSKPPTSYKLIEFPDVWWIKLAVLRPAAETDSPSARSPPMAAPPSALSAEAKATSWHCEARPRVKRCGELYE